MTDSDEDSETERADQTGIEEIEYCAHCGAKLPNGVWCPIRTDTETDGTLRIQSFCDDSCKEAWPDDDATSGDTEED